jgi:hypothetical protein
MGANTLLGRYTIAHETYVGMSAWIALLNNTAIGGGCEHASEADARAAAEADHAACIAAMIEQEGEG